MRNFLTTGFEPGALPIRSTLPNSRKWEGSNLHAAFATTLLSKEGQYQLWDTSKEWDREESNLRRAGLQPAALPLELSFQKENHLSLSDKWFSNVQSIVTYLHIAQFKRSTISDKDITKSPVFVIKTNLNIPLYLLKLSHHSCRSHCFCSPLLNIFYSLSRLKTSDSNCASCSQGKRATITPRSQGE